MEYESAEFSHDKSDDNIKNELAESVQPEKDSKDATNPTSSSSIEDNVQLKSNDQIAGTKSIDDTDVPSDSSTVLDYFTRAGGFGATDDISSFLPVASDFTDFEASLRQARDYEDPQVDVSRPGLGWSDVKNCPPRQESVLAFWKIL